MRGDGPRTQDQEKQQVLGLFHWRSRQARSWKSGLGVTSQ